MSETRITARALLDDVGLVPGGHVYWGDPVPSSSPGVYLVELGAPSGQLVVPTFATAPVSTARIGEWLERAATLRLHGERPSAAQVAARLSHFWWPQATVLYVMKAKSEFF